MERITKEDRPNRPTTIFLPVGYYLRAITEALICDYVLADELRR